MVNIMKGDGKYEGSPTLSKNFTNYGRETARRVGDFKVNLSLNFRSKIYVSRQYLWTVRRGMVILKLYR